MNSHSFGPSVEELKSRASPSSNASSFYSTSLAASALNLPKEVPPPASTIGFSSNFCGANIASSQKELSSSVNWRTTLQLVNSLNQRDRMKLDLNELLGGPFSREYVYGNEERPVLQFDKLSLIPEILLSQIQKLKGSFEGNSGRKCFLGLFPEINRAWMTAGNEIYLWSFENNRDFTCYINKSLEDVIDVALVPAKENVFISGVRWLLVVVTPTDINLLAVKFEDEDASSGSENRRPPSHVNVSLHETGLKYASDEVNMVSCVGGDDGRIFLAGSDGNIYELLYQGESGSKFNAWFLSSRCKKLNRTASALRHILPTFLGNLGSPGGSRVVQLTIDSSRGLLYGLTEDSGIQVYWIGKNADTFEHIAFFSFAALERDSTRLCPVGVISSGSALQIVSLHPLSQDDSQQLCLLAICRSGVRIYFHPSYGHLESFNNPLVSSTTSSFRRNAPNGIRISHVRAAPEDNRVRDPKKMVHRWSPNIHCAFHRHGVTLAANTATVEEDILLGMLVNPSAMNPSGFNAPLEHSIDTSVEGKIWDIGELSSKSVDSQKSSSELSVPRRAFAILTNVGVYVYSRLRPIDQMNLLLSQRSLPWDSLERLFSEYGADVACALALELCSSMAIGGNSTLRSNDFSDTLFSNALTVLIQLGGRLKLLDSEGQDNFGFAVDSRPLGRLIATQPDIQSSSLHDGCHLYFSRIVGLFWKVQGIQQLAQVLSGEESGLLANLYRFRKFLNDYIPVIGERRLHGIDLNKKKHLSTIEAEMDSLRKLSALIELVSEAISFISICSDYQVWSQVSVPHGDVCTLENLLSGEVFRDLGAVLVQNMLKIRGPVRSFSESLRLRCPTYFSEQDVLLQEALESLNAARLARSRSDRSDALESAMKNFVICIVSLSLPQLLSILDELDLLCAPDASIRLSAKYLDYKSDGLEESERLRLYDRMLKSLSCTGFDEVNTQSLSAKYPDVPIDELRGKCLRFLSLNCSIAEVHCRLYDWLILGKFISTLMELFPTSFLMQYLLDTFSARLDSHRDLLWKWLARQGRFKEAATILALLAECREFSLRLTERIEYLSLAVTHCKSGQSGGGSTAPLNSEGRSIVDSLDFSLIHSAIGEGIELAELEERLEVAHLQLGLLQEALRNRGNNPRDPLCVELDGGMGLLNVTEMFNRYARPYGLTEGCLRLIHASGLVNDRLTAQLWQEIIVPYTREGKYFELGEKVTELGRKFYPSPGAFPIAHLIDVLGRFSADRLVDSDWLVVVLVNCSISFSALAEELHRFFLTPPSKSWLNPQHRQVLLEMIAILHVLWFNGKSCHDLASRIKLTAVVEDLILQRLRSYAAAADELRSPSLINEFGSLMRNLAQFQ